MKKGDKKPTWKKVTRGTIVLRQPVFMRLKYKEVFKATVEELGKFAGSEHFQLVKNVDGAHAVDTDDIGDIKVEQGKEEYSIEKIKNGAYNVLNSAGEAMNDEPIKKGKAEELKAALEAE
jgi:hypothetical protein